MIFTLTFPIYVGRNSLMLLFKCPGGGVLLGILGGGVPPSSPHSDPISDQKMSFSTSVFRPGGGHKTQQHKTEIMSSLLRLKPQQKEFLKFISNSHITLSFLWIWNWKRRTH